MSRPEHETVDSAGTKHKGTLVHDDQRSTNGWEQRADGKWYKVDYYKLHEERQWVEIITKLFIGFGFRVARNDDFIREKNITRILVLGTEAEAEELTRLPLTVRHFATDENTIEQYFEQAVALLREAANEQQSVLVLCRDGLSLSPLIIIAYLVAIHRWTLQSAVERVTQRLKITLAEWALTVLATWEKYVLKQSVVIEKVVQPSVKQEVVVEEYTPPPPPPQPVIVEVPQMQVIEVPQVVYQPPPAQVSYIVHEPRVELPPPRWYYSTPPVVPQPYYVQHQPVQQQVQYYTEYAQPQYVQQYVQVPQQQYVQVDTSYHLREQEQLRLQQEQQLRLQHEEQLRLQREQEQLRLQQEQQLRLQREEQFRLQQEQQYRLQQEEIMRQKRITQQQSTSGVEVTRVTTTTQTQAFIGNASWHSGGVRVQPVQHQNPQTPQPDERPKLPPPF